jgi:hypothetical protein
MDTLRQAAHNHARERLPTVLILLLWENRESLSLPLIFWRIVGILLELNLYWVKKRRGRKRKKMGKKRGKKGKRSEAKKVQSKSLFSRSSLDLLLST